MLYLLPNLLTESQSHASQLPTSVDAAVATLSGLIAESEKAGRHFLRRFTFPSPKTFRDIPIRLLNEHSTPSDKRALIEQIKQGGLWGLVSDCGMPCLADPGADLVLMARECGIEVQTFAGPSSILLALVLSGLGAQCFTFHGYLPKDEEPLIQELRKIEKLSAADKSTHLFIETPYRNLRLWEKMLTTLDSQTWACVACDLTAPTQHVETHKVGEWKRRPLPDIAKRPAIFLIRR